MPNIEYAPFGPSILKQSSRAAARAIWCCVAPYILRPKNNQMRLNFRETYIAQLVRDLDSAKLTPTEQTIQKRALEWKRNTLEWIKALVDAPSESDIRDFEWGREVSDVKEDYLTTYRIVALYLRLIHSSKDSNDDQKNGSASKSKEEIWFSIQNAIFICQSDPLDGCHSADNKIRKSLRIYKRSSHLIFGMLQAAANNGKHDRLIMPELKHVELLSERGHEFIRDGLQYASYAQRELTSVKPRNTKKPWLSRQEAWTLPDEFGDKDEQIRGMLQPLTEQERSYVTEAPERLKKRSPTPNPS